jgi:hypothetical protein
MTGLKAGDIVTFRFHRGFGAYLTLHHWRVPADDCLNIVVHNPDPTTAATSEACGLDVLAFRT